MSQWPIAPDQFFDYQIRPEIGDAGSYFYHSHVDFQQITAHGAIIVDDAKKPPYKYDDEITLLTADYYDRDDKNVTTGLLADPFVWSGEPLAVSIGGKTGTSGFNNATDESCEPLVLDVEPGKTYRLRVIGATVLSLVELGIENHYDNDSLQVIEADGAYTKQAPTDHIQVASGQRFSYLLKTKTEHELKALKKNEFWIRMETRLRPSVVTGYALLRYSSSYGSKPSSRKALPKVPPVTLPQNVTDYLEYALQPYSKDECEKFPKLSEVTRTVKIVVNQRGTFTNGTFTSDVEWDQNNNTWKMELQAHKNQVPYLVDVYKTGKSPNYTLALENGGYDPSTQTFPAKVGEVLDIVWENNNGPSGGWDFHPFHGHGNHFWDLGSGNGTYNAAKNEKNFENFTPAKRDTTILYKYAQTGVPHTTAGWRAWRLRVTEDNVGAWMLHCHIAQHAIMGMNTVWVFGDTTEIKKKFPNTGYIHGYLDYGGDAYGAKGKDPFVYHYYPDN